MSTDSQCPIIVGDGTAQIVHDGYERYIGFANQAFALSVNEINELGNPQLTSITPNVTFNFTPSTYTFNRPTPPVLPVIAYQDQGSVPNAPALIAPTVTFDTAPAEPPNLVPTLPEYAQPTVTLSHDLSDPAPVSAPGFDATAFAPAVPVQPNLTLPDVVAMDIIPAFPDPVLPTAPSAPPVAFSFTPTEYTDSLLPQIQAKIGNIIDTGEILPVDVARELRERAMEDVVDAENQASDAAFNEFASRGFELPPGMLVRRIDRVRQDAQNQRGKLNRDIYIQQNQAAIENLRFAVTSGISLESALIAAHNEFMRLSMESVRLAATIDVEFYNGRVAAFNAEMQGAAIEATITRERATAILDAARLRLESQRARGEMTEAQWVDAVRALNAEADVYRADLAGRQASAESYARAASVQLEADRTRLATRAEERAGFEAEWVNWSRMWQTNDTRARVAELATTAWGARIRAFGEVQQAKIAQVNLGIAVNDQTLRAWHGNIEALTARIGAERDRINALATVVSSQTEVYRTQASVESAAADTDMRVMLANVQAETARTNVAAKNVELAISQLVENNKLRLQAQDSIARVGAQLTASSLSAVNLSAGIRSDLSQRFGCSTSFNYSGAIDPST